MAAEDFFIRAGLPPGLSSDEPMPYEYRRWNGTVWTDPCVDLYNKTARMAVIAWRQGLDAKAERYVEALYRMAHEYDQ